MRHLFLELWKKWTTRQIKSENILENETKEAAPEEYYENLYLDQLREIMEQVIDKRGISYAKFAPVLVEGEEPEDIINAGRDLAADLNYLTIIAENDTYYEDFTDNMYIEHGLIVKIWRKEALNGMEIQSAGFPGNVILDFQKKEGIKIHPGAGKKLYIPIFKRRWESCTNLDIAVPIGYNTVIVRSDITGKEQPIRDWLEEAFYENK